MQGNHARSKSRASVVDAEADLLSSGSLLFHVTRLNSVDPSVSSWLGGCTGGSRVVSLVRLRQSLRALCWLAAAAALSCGSEPAASLPPAGALVMENGVRSIVVRSGAGRSGAEAEWWSVAWSDVPCSTECEHVYNGHRGTKIYDPFRSNLMAMREGEVRRLWIPRNDGNGFWAADVELYQVYDTAAGGGPAIPQPPQPRFPVQPYERTQSASTAK